MLEGEEIDVIIVGQTGVGKSSLINMIIGVPDGSAEAAKVSNGVRPCTTQTTVYSTSLETGLRCRLWDTRGLDESVGTNYVWPMAKMMDRIRQLASQQVRELKETLRDRTGVTIPILVWCIDATRIDVPVHWQQFHKVYVEYCERKAIPVVVITRGPPRATDWETKCTDQLRSLDLGVDVPFRVVRMHRGPSSQEYVEDSKALRDLIAELVMDNSPWK